MRFLVFIFAFLFIAAIFFVRDEILSKRAKIIATALIVLLCAGAYFYESVSERSAKLEEEMVFKFNAGARLRCGGAINSAAEARGAANSFSEKHSADAKNLGAKAGEANLNAQSKAASTAQANDTQNSAVQTNEQASAAQVNGAVSGGQNFAQSPTSKNSKQQGDTQSLTPQNSANQGGTRSSASQNSTQNSAQRDDTQTSNPQSSAQNSKTTQNSAPQSLNLQSSAQIVTRENFTYSFSMGAFIAKKSAGAEFKGKTYKIKECVYDQ
ncbi:hypothetical protein [uncultured Campylobacter sp.]|uniref:hypothetical protein n=1 Tax=uncultured Campylobacter sp. TaxID=218934 RepID=UPI00260547C3|nr:hypothetical protein [uncultured Campylobacter sp.]